MKRQSIAEMTLAKQVKNIETEIANLQLEESHIQAKLETLTNMRAGMAQEIDRLREARAKASEIRK
ncbi:MAG TPA: hypothetical protein VNV63_02360 [Nitrospiria bacterium]|nr:hypothetical protein [Nitrospiria bacterium]